MVIAPFHFWGFLGDHEQRDCEPYYHALYACTIPTVRFTHASRLTFPHALIIDIVSTM
jgi:hypothetical protein